MPYLGATNPIDMRTVSHLSFRLLSTFVFLLFFTAIAMAHDVPDTAILPRQNMKEFRRMQVAAASDELYVTDAGRQGIFVADADDRQTPDDSAMVLVTASGRRFRRMTPNGTVDVRWFGAVPSDGLDDWAAIQKAVDFCTAHNDKYSTVHLGPGIYVISQPIMLYRLAGNGYGFHSTSLEGESTFWESSGSGTTIQCNFKDKFAIGIQLGKGNRISRLKIIGGFKPPFRDKYSFYRSTFEEFKDPTCRDSDFSPYSGIVIDPFSNSASQVPEDGGYPGYRSWYRGNGASSGSTGISIEDVFISGFVVGLCSAPNSFTRNAELTLINKIQFSNMKLCISGSQDQEKDNVVTNLGCWGVTHTVFGTGLYGAHTPGNWYVENCNIAGYVNRLVFNNQAGYFASHFRNIFSESLGCFGMIFSNQSTTVESSELGFAYYNHEAGQYTNPQIDCSGVTFLGCNIRMYGTFLPVTIHGSSTYIGCSFETVPFADYSVRDYPTFVNSFVQSSSCPLGFSGSRNIYPAEAWQCHSYGNYRITSNEVSLTTDNAQPAMAYPIDLTGGGVRLHITDSSGVRSAIVPLKPEQSRRLRKGDAICNSAGENTQAILGVVTSISPNSFTLSYIPSQIKGDQQFFLSVFLPLYTMTFLGDVTAGSNIISNVKVDFGDAGKFISHGGLMSCNRFINTESNQAWRRSLFRIVAYDAGARTITVDQRSTRTAKGVYFSNTNAVKDLHMEPYGEGLSGLTGRADVLLQEGGHIFSRDSTGSQISYRVTRSGFSDAQASHDTRQAEWRKE